MDDQDGTSRRTSRRRILSAVGLTLAAASLAACSGSSRAVATVVPAATASGTTSPTQTTSASAAVSAQSTTITFARWQVTPSRIKISVDDPIARFEQVQPNTKVEALVIPNGPPYTAKLLTMIAGDVAPDVMGLPDPFGILPLFGQKGVLVDLGPLIARDAATVQPTDFLPQALKVGQWQGKQYGLLISPLSTAVLLYNADALQNAGTPFLMK